MISPIPFRQRHRLIEAECGDSRVQPQHASSCDIKTIMARHRAIGVSPFQPLSPDVCGQAVRYTYAEAFAMVENAQEQFMTLPAAVRDRFRNDPASLFDFILDDGNRDEAIKLGLIPKPKPVEKALTAQDIAAAVREGMQPKQADKSAQTS